MPRQPRQSPRRNLTLMPSLDDAEFNGNDHCFLLFLRGDTQFDKADA